MERGRSEGEPERSAPLGGRLKLALSALLAAATPLESLLVEMYGPRVEATLLCGRQETLPGAQKAILASTWRIFPVVSSFAVSDSRPDGCSSSRTRRCSSDG